MSPAMTNPLSRMRSRTSTKPGGRAVIRVDRSLDTFVLHSQEAVLLKRLRVTATIVCNAGERLTSAKSDAPQDRDRDRALHPLNQIVPSALEALLLTSLAPILILRFVQVRDPRLPCGEPPAFRADDG